MALITRLYVYGATMTNEEEDFWIVLPVETYGISSMANYWYCEVCNPKQTNIRSYITDPIAWTATDETYNYGKLLCPACYEAHVQTRLR